MAAGSKLSHCLAAVTPAGAIYLPPAVRVAQVNRKSGRWEGVGARESRCLTGVKDNRFGGESCISVQARVIDGVTGGAELRDPFPTVVPHAAIDSPLSRRRSQVNGKERLVVIKPGDLQCLAGNDVYTFCRWRDLPRNARVFEKMRALCDPAGIGV